MSNFDDIFEPAPQAEDFDKEAWAAKKKAERDERYATADATAEEICTDGGKFRDYLDVQAKFHRYSATKAIATIRLCISVTTTMCRGLLQTCLRARRPKAVNPTTRFGTQRQVCCSWRSFST